MQIFNATPLQIEPKMGFLNNQHFWPNDGWTGDPRERSTMPADAAIIDTMNQAGACEWYYIDDSHHLTFTLLARLLERLRKLFPGRKFVIYGLPGNTGKACNLLIDWLYPQWAQWVFDNAVKMASVPVWRGKPLAWFVDAICPELYVDQYVRADTDLDVKTAASVVLDYALHAARYVAGEIKSLAVKPVIPMLHVARGTVSVEQEPDLAKWLLGFCRTRKVDMAAVWSGPDELDAPLNRVAFA